MSDVPDNPEEPARLAGGQAAMKAVLRVRTPYVDLPLTLESER